MSEIEKWEDEGGSIYEEPYIMVFPEIKDLIDDLKDIKLVPIVDVDLNLPPMVFGTVKLDKRENVGGGIPEFIYTKDLKFPLYIE